MEVISLTDDAFYTLLNKLKEQIRAGQNSTPDRWIDGTEAMRILKITSRTTLQKLRDEGAIRYSQPMTKVLLYDRESILQYIEKHAKNTF